MPTINDLKKKALNDKGYTGTISDAEYRWLRDQVAPYSGTIPDMWKKYLEDRGYTSGPLNSRLNSYLKDLGFEGSLPNQLFQFWKSGGSPEWAQGFDLWGDFTKSDVLNGLNSTYEFIDTHPSDISADYANGDWETFAPNALVRTDLGIQTVLSRTNGIRNNSMVGASVGSPGTLPNNWSSAPNGLSIDVAGTGTDPVLGLPYVDLRLYGTSTGSNLQVRWEGSTNIVVANGQVYSHSAFAALTDGLLPGGFSLAVLSNVFDSGGQYLNEATLGTQIPSGQPTSVLQRFERTNTINHVSAAFARPYLQMGIPSATAMDFTLRIVAPQFELGEFASPPILTTGRAVAVTGNRQVSDGHAEMLSGGYGFVHEYEVRGGIFQLMTALAIGDGTAANRDITEWGSSGGVRLSVRANNASEGVTSNTGDRTTGRFILAGVHVNGQAKVRLDGDTDKNFVARAYGVGMDKIAIGGYGYATAQNGYFKHRRLGIKGYPVGYSHTDAWNEIWGAALQLAQAVRTEGDSFVALNTGVQYGAELTAVSGRTFVNTGVGGSTIESELSRMTDPSNALYLPLVHVFWDGSENGFVSIDDYLGRYQQIINSLGHNKFIIHPPCYNHGQTSNTQRDSIAAAMASRWPNNFQHWKGVLLENPDGSLDDSMYIDLPTDTTHLSQSAMALMAASDWSFMQSKGW